MTTITQENVKFNGTLENAAVLKNSGGFRTLILTDDLSAADRAQLDSFVAKYGSNPLAAATAGKATVAYPAGTVGATATGLGSVAAPVAGKATVVFDPSVSSGSTSFLDTSAGTKGFQTLTYVNGGENFSIETGAEATSGSQGVALTVTNLLYATPTGLANDTTEYTATVTVDGTPVPLTVVGSTAQTYADLMPLLETAMTGVASVDLSAADGGPVTITFTSDTTGITSTVDIVDVDLFSSLTLFDSITTAVDGTDSTLVDYTLLVSVDGAAAQELTISSADLADVDSLSSAIASVITGATTDFSSAGVVTIKSDTVGDGSTIGITGGTLLTLGFATGFPVPGADRSRTYTAIVTVDENKVKTVSFSGVGMTTIGDVITAINADLGADATAAITGGNIVITSATTGIGSSVRIQDVGALFSTLQGYDHIEYTSGSLPDVYTARIDVDGTPIMVSVSGSNAQTFTTLVDELNTDLSTAATAALVGGSIVITSATTGTTSTVDISFDNLFKHVTGFAGVTKVDGATDLVEEMKQVRVGSASLFDLYDVKVVGSKPAVPPVPATLPKTQPFTYYGGSPAAWRYLEDDTLVNPA